MRHHLQICRLTLPETSHQNPPEEIHFLLDCVCADGKGQQHLGLGTCNTIYIGARNSLVQQEREEGKKVTASEQAFPTDGSNC